MNTLYRTLHLNNKHLLVQTAQQYDHNNKIKISASINDKFAALSLARLNEYSSGNK